MLRNQCPLSTGLHSGGSTQRRERVLSHAPSSGSHDCAGNATTSFMSTVKTYMSTSRPTCIGSCSSSSESSSRLYTSSRRVAGRCAVVPRAEEAVGVPDKHEHEMPADAAQSILQALRAADVAVVVGGGWAVDALLGEQTRPHADLDVWVPAEQFERLVRPVVGIGLDRLYPWGDDRPWNFVLQWRDSSPRPPPLRSS